MANSQKFYCIVDADHLDQADRHSYGPLNTMP